MEKIKKNIKLINNLITLNRKNTKEYYSLELEINSGITFFI